MKKTASLLALLTLVLASCANNQTTTPLTPSNQSSSTETNKESNVYLTGNLELSDSKITLTKNGDTYSYSNLKLRRGDSFYLYQDEKHFSYQNLTEKEGFSEGKNGYIDVLNEGIYDVSLTGESLTLTKIDSTYSKVELVSQSQETRVSFTKNDDFTFSLSDTYMNYREVFSIELDGQKMPLDYLDYENVYFGTLLLSKDGSIKSMKKGTFDFTLNFANENPLSIVSPDLSEANTLPTNLTSYQTLINTFTNQFEDKGVSLTGSLTTTNGDETTSKTYEETINNNDHYYLETTITGEEQETFSLEKLITDSNYYSFIKENDKVTLNDAALIDNSQSADGEEESTIKKVDHKLMTTDQAISNIKNVSGYDHSIGNLLNAFSSPSHLSRPSDAEKTAFSNSFKITSNYDGEYGDSMNVVVSAIETSKPTFHSSYNPYVAFKDEVNFKVNKNGQLESGTVKITKYKDSDNLFKDDSYELSDTAEVEQTDTYTFTYTYTDNRTNTSSFKINPTTYVATTDEATCLIEYDIDAGSEEIDMSIIVPGLTDNKMVNKDDFQIMEYDSKYLTQGTGDTKSFTTNSIAGDTVVKIGTPYSLKTKDVTIHISLKKPTYLTASGVNFSTYGTTYYVGSTYEFKVTGGSGVDTSIKVESSDETVAKVVSVDDQKTAREKGEAHFKVEALKEGTATITVTSLVSPSTTTTINMTIKKPITMQDIAGTYCYSSYNGVTTITLSADGTAVLNYEDNNYNFTYKVEGSSILLVASDKISAFKANLNAQSNNRYYLNRVEVTIDNVASNISGYSSFYLINEELRNTSWKTEDSTASLVLSNYEISSGTQSANCIITDTSDSNNNHTLGFTIEFSSSNSNYECSSFKLDNSSKWGIEINADYENEKFTMTVSGSNAGFFADKSYTFILQNS